MDFRIGRTAEESRRTRPDLTSVEAVSSEKPEITDILEIVAVQNPEMRAMREGACGNSQIGFAAARPFDFSVKFGGAFRFYASKCNCVNLRKEGFLNLDLFFQAWTAQPFKKNDAADAEWFRSGHQFAQPARRTFCAAKRVDQSGGIEVNHPRQPARRDFRIS